MRVKIGDKIYDSESEPIMLIMNEVDKDNISNTKKIHEDGTLRFTTFPSGMEVEPVREWMVEDIKS